MNNANDNEQEEKKAAWEKLDTSTKLNPDIATEAESLRECIRSLFPKVAEHDTIGVSGDNNTNPNPS